MSTSLFSSFPIPSTLPSSLSSSSTLHTAPFVPSSYSSSSSSSSSSTPHPLHAAFKQAESAYNAYDWEAPAELKLDDSARVRVEDATSTAAVEDENIVTEAVAGDDSATAARTANGFKYQVPWTLYHALAMQQNPHVDVLGRFTIEGVREEGEDGLGDVDIKGFFAPKVASAAISHKQTRHSTISARILIQYKYYYKTKTIPWSGKSGLLHQLLHWMSHMAKEQQRPQKKDGYPPLWAFQFYTTALISSDIVLFFHAIHRAANSSHAVAPDQHGDPSYARDDLMRHCIEVYRSPQPDITTDSLLPAQLLDLQYKMYKMMISKRIVALQADKKPVVEKRVSIAKKLREWQATLDDLFRQLHEASKKRDGYNKRVAGRAIPSSSQATYKAKHVNRYTDAHTAWMEHLQLLPALEERRTKQEPKSGMNTIVYPHAEAILSDLNRLAAFLHHVQLRQQGWNWSQVYYRLNKLTELHVDLYRDMSKHATKEDLRRLFVQWMLDAVNGMTDESRRASEVLPRALNQGWLKEELNKFKAVARKQSWYTAQSKKADKFELELSKTDQEPFLAFLSLTEKWMKAIDEALNEGDWDEEMRCSQITAIATKLGFAYGRLPVEHQQKKKNAQLRAIQRNGRLLRTSLPQPQLEAFDAEIMQPINKMIEQSARAHLKRKGEVIAEIVEHARDRRRRKLKTGVKEEAVNVEVQGDGKDEKDTTTTGQTISDREDRDYVDVDVDDDVDEDNAELECGSEEER